MRRFLFVFFAFLIVPLTVALPAYADTGITWTTGSDFSAGTLFRTSTTDVSGDVTLSQSSTYTETTSSQFSEGNTNPLDDTSQSTQITSTSGGEIQLPTASFGNALPTYNTNTSPSIDGSDVNYIYVDTPHNLLYVSTAGGLSVLNTNGTLDPSDDTFFTYYNTASNPALLGNLIYQAFVDDATGLLYVSTDGGLAVINTQGTTDPSDDTLVISYKTNSVPAIASNTVRGAFLDTAHSLLYVMTAAGLSVINTSGTVDASDDTLVTTYNSSSSPVALSSSGVYSAWLSSSGFLYVGTDFGGLNVIDTKGTIDPTDDTVVTVYTTNTTPSIGSNEVRGSFLDESSGYLYAYGGLGAAVAIIDTKNTSDPTDDTVVGSYTSELPANSTTVYHAFLDGTTHLLYISTDTGYVVINTQGTADLSDDTIATTYASLDTNENGKKYSVLDSATGVLYITSDAAGVDAIDTHGTADTGDDTPVGYSITYNASGSYESAVLSLEDVPTDSFSYSGSVSGDQTASVSYRTSTGEVPWLNSFDDATDSGYLGNPYPVNEYSEFQSAVKSGGTFTLSDPVDPANPYIDAWFDTGEPDGYFPSGSTITARVRMNNSNSGSNSFSIYFGIDNWSDYSSSIDLPDNQWTTITFTPSQDFSKIGFEPYSNTNTWDPSDSFEIDWIQIDHSILWGDWSTPCTTPDEACAINPSDVEGKNVIQYKVDLTTSDTTATPSVDSVTFSADGSYPASGTYTSDAHTFTTSQDLHSFNADVSTSSETGVSFEYSINNGSSWHDIPTVPYTFPDHTLADSFKWRATLTTSDSAQTPAIHAVTLMTSDIPETPVPTYHSTDTAAAGIPGQVTQIMDPDGNIYIAGTFSGTVDFNPQGTADEHTSRGETDIYLSKYNDAGEYQWTKTFGGVGDDSFCSYAKCLALDASGNIYLAGHYAGTVDFSVTDTSDERTSNGGDDLFVTSFTPNGTRRWTNTVGGIDDELSCSNSTGFGSESSNRCLTVDASGNVYLIGNFSGTVDFDPSGAVDDHSSVSTGGGADPHDFFLTSYDTNGNYRYTNTVGGDLTNTTGDVSAYSVATDSSGNVYVAGSFDSFDIDFDPSGSTDVKHSYQNDDFSFFLTSYTSDGSYRWTNTFGSDNNFTKGPISLQVDHGDHVYLTGPFENISDFDPGASTVPATGGNTYIVSYGNDGTYRWSKTFGHFGAQACADYTDCLLFDSADSVYLTDSFTSTIDLNPGGAGGSITSGAGRDVFIVKYLSDGSLSWVKDFGGTGDDYSCYYSNCLALDKSGNIYFTGEFTDTVDFNPSGGDEHTSNGDYDAYLTSYTAGGTYRFTKTWGGTGDDEAYAPLIDAIHVAGYFNDTVDFNPDDGVAEFDAPIASAFYLLNFGPLAGGDPDPSDPTPPTSPSSNGSGGGNPSLFLGASASTTPTALPSLPNTGIAFDYSVVASIATPLYQIRIPAIGVDTGVVAVGTTVSGEIGVPESPSQAGWYEGSALPSEKGNTIIDGHSGWRNASAVFDDLHLLNRGDVVTITDEEGKRSTYVVRSATLLDPSANTSALLNSSDDGKHLVLITCAGAWDSAEHAFTKRLVVVADKI